MDFDFSDDQQALRDAVQRWAERAFPVERRLALARAGGATRSLYRELAALGLTALAVAPEHGGVGHGEVEAMVVMEELGRALVPAPYAEAALLAPALLDAAPEALRSTWLPRIADGSALIVPAVQERAARWCLQRVGTRAVPHAGGWRLDGLKQVVPAGDEADAFIVPARTAGAENDAAGIALFLVERAGTGVALHGTPTQDGARCATLTLTAAPAEWIAGDGLTALEKAADTGIAAACAEGVGLMDRLLALTIEYMRTRRQFGAPIASFQALRHRIADVKMQLELARSMSWYATLSLAEPIPARRRALSRAKLQFGSSARFVGQQCIQLHGGIGVTDDCVASHCFKRLTMLDLAWGDTLHHLGEVSARMQVAAGVGD
jgi:alkylation response protein AidB-like acyl-CoA dehydrogenase